MVGNKPKVYRRQVAFFYIKKWGELPSIKFKKMIKNDTTDNGEEYLIFKVKDNKGVECLATFIGKGDSVYFIVHYDHINYRYNLIERK